MKFSVKLVNGNGCRLGALSGLRSNPEILYETPLSLVVTRGGSIPHLMKDVYHKTFSRKSILCIPAQHFTDQLDVLQAFKKGVATFAALPTHSVCIVVQDPTENTRSGYNDNSSVSLWNTTGRTKISPEKYVNLVKEMQPDWYESLNDADTDTKASKKRVEKSKKNSLRFLEQCLVLHRAKAELKEVGIFAPLLGGLTPTERRKWSDSIREEEVDGYSLLGLHLNGSSAQILDEGVVRKCVQASLENIASDKMRQAQGSFSLKSVLEMIECGVDVFDSSSAYLATERGAAFCFPNTMETILKEDSNVSDCPKSSNCEKDDKEDQAAKKMKIESSSQEPPLAAKSEQLLQKERIRYETNLKDKRYFESKEPLLKGCKCYTCSNFSQAYVHHLLSAKEMLAPVLLMIHNLHHWELFFATIRQAIKRDQFHLLKSAFLKTSAEQVNEEIS